MKNLNESKKCKESIQYFIEKYCRIKDTNGKFHKIKLQDYQIEILKLLEKKKHLKIKKRGKNS